MADPQMGPKWAPNGTKMGPKWAPNGVPNGPQMGPKWDPNGPQMGPQMAPHGPQMGPTKITILLKRKLKTHWVFPIRRNLAMRQVLPHCLRIASLSFFSKCCWPKSSSNSRAHPVDLCCLVESSVDPKLIKFVPTRFKLFCTFRYMFRNLLDTPENPRPVTMLIP